MSKLPFELSYGKTITSAVVIAIFAIVFVLLGKLKKKALSGIKSAKDPKNILVRRIVILARVIVVIFALLTVSQINGINIGSAIAGLGIISAVVGLALQDLLKDAIMGFHIVSDKFFSIGDVVEYGGKEGIISEFSLTSTKIEVLDDNSVITVSNRNISEIRNVKDCFVFDLPLSYDEDAEQIHGFLQSVALKIKKIDGMKDCTFEGTQSFEASSVIYRFKMFCNPQKKPAIRRKALFEIQKELKNKNIKIPYNKIDVNLKEEN